ncbi:MAG: dephospho-CoA kinase, partial [Longimicrobiales bacterium]
RDAGARDRLEAILHPEIARLRALEERRLRDAGVDIVVFEIPLLFEAGMEDEVDVIVLVDAPRPERLERVVVTRGIDMAEAERMEAAQHDPVRKRERADIIIDNDGSLEELEAAAERAWDELQRRRVGSA